MDDLYGRRAGRHSGRPGNALTGLDPQEPSAALREAVRNASGPRDPRRAVGRRFGERPGGLTLDGGAPHPDGLRLGELEGGRLDDMVTTPSGKVELVHELFTADIPRLLARLDLAELTSC